MAISRKFLGLERPALSAAADYLLDRFGTSSAADLGNVLVVVPGRRAGRRLMEILVERSAEQRRVLTPPEIETVGRVPEQLYTPKRPFANELTQRLTWVEALRSIDRDTLTAVVPRPPQVDELPPWLELADVIRRQHTELAADGFDFSDVAEKGGAVPGFTERERWLALRRIQELYLQRLDDLELWDKQTARLYAIKYRECTTDHELIFLGTTDLNVSVRQMLNQVYENVTALVFAPDTWSNRFDEHGCLQPHEWADVRIPVPMENIHLADDPPDQADEVARCLARYKSNFRADQITIGAAVESTVPQIQRRLSECEVASRWGPGRPLSESSPYRMLEAISALVRSDRFEQFAAIVRHPDISSWIARSGVRSDWLSQLDEYYNNHLQFRLSGEWLGDQRDCGRVKQVYRLVRELVRPLQAAPRPLHDWSEPILQTLRTVYGQRTFDRTDPADQMTLAACEKLRDAVLDFASVPANLMPKVSAADAIRWALESIATETVPPPADPQAVELLGWLELPLDDAPGLVVCGLNEGSVPDSINSDLFLPNRLRSQLGLMDNGRRYARDAYALSVLVETRQRLDVVVGRRNADGDPLLPSRLLFAVEREQLAQRTLELFQQPLPASAKQPLAGGLLAALAEPDFPIPRPRPLSEPIPHLSVTSFRSYLACRYRFYLRHVLRLESLDDAAEELDGAAFGTMLHEVLRRFGASPCRDSTDAREIEDVLLSELNACREEFYGNFPRAAVVVQIEQMRLRLSAFAHVQAHWAAQGWRIEHTEVPDDDHKEAGLKKGSGTVVQSTLWAVPATVPDPFLSPLLMVDGEPIGLRGRIDRIDVNVESGERVILDYKSSDTARRPESTHQQRDQWIDLQLPLYRHLARSLGIEGPLRLGYINLPKDTSATGFAIANWSDADLDEADQVAFEVVRGIRNEDFWPPTDPPPDFSEEFAAICQDTVFEERKPKERISRKGAATQRRNRE